MPIEVSVLSAFIVGLLGGVHCVGMCGGIVGALSLGLSQQERLGGRRWIYQLAYNLARITSYTLAGALFGGLTWMVSNWSGVNQLQIGLQLVAALFMVALGLYLGGWWQGLAYIERAGGLLWVKLEPLGRRFLPVTTPTQAFALGLVWGWLPCGLVYSVLVWAVASGDPLYGALLMLAFGLGTLPNLMLMGLAAARLSARVRDPRTRRLAGLAVMLFGVYFLFGWFTR